MDPEAVAAGIEASPNSVLRWLSAQEHDWLLIYDNADCNPNEIEGYLQSTVDASAARLNVLRDISVVKERERLEKPYGILGGLGCHKIRST